MQRTSFRAVLFVLAAAFAVGALAAPTTTVPIKHAYVMGDSLSDQGNLLFATTDLGPDFGQPTIPDPLRYSLGRFSNGPNYVDQLAAKLGIPVFASELGGTNFAFGASRTEFNRVEARGIPYLPDGVYPIGAYPWSLNAQIDEFLADVKHRGADPTGLYVVFHGSNDLSDALTEILLFQRPPNAKIATAVGGVVRAVLAFKSAGARTVLVMTAPNLGLVPSVTRFGPGVAALADSLSVQFNLALRAGLANIDGPNVIVFDTYEFMGRVFGNAAAYGFTNVTQPCYAGFVFPSAFTPCADPEHYAFWDQEHPTTRLHAILADELYTTWLHCSAKGKGQAPAHCAVNTH